MFDTRGGKFDHSIYGDAGDDTFITSSASLRVIESVGEGKDTIQSTVTYDLSVNGSYEIENLTLLGSGNSSGTGNQYKNTIIGNSGDNHLNGLTGNDRLTGKGGADIFIFATGTGHDTIADFEAGSDRINLSHLNMITDFGDLAAHHLSTVGGDAHITAGSDVIIIKGVTAGELDAADFLF